MVGKAADPVPSCPVFTVLGHLLGCPWSPLLPLVPPIAPFSRNHSVGQQITQAQVSGSVFTLTESLRQPCSPGADLQLREAG